MWIPSLRECIHELKLAQALSAAETGLAMVGRAEYLGIWYRSLDKG